VCVNRGARSRRSPSGVGSSPASRPASPRRRSLPSPPSGVREPCPGRPVRWPSWGQGLAGLACADALAARGITATVFEGSTRAGGRCFSLSGVFPGQVAERGGEFIDTTHSAMRHYANKLDLAVEDVGKAPGEVFYVVNGQRHDEAEVVEGFRAFVPAIQADLRQLGQPTASSFTDEDQLRDFTSLAEYLDTRGASPLIRAVVDVAYATGYGLDIERQSCLNFLLFIHADRRSKFHPFGVFSDERFTWSRAISAWSTGWPACCPSRSASRTRS
jgi:monoamine oxidase